ncbi:MAG: DUF559 domain-containing protein [Armatimonadetes bacterium]|nr:DUF559 domain-containing protein [Armatimonadota bacterium]MBS1727444.1 DUF559 domain-containing protein [Armatimonadota bacterium]
MKIIFHNIGKLRTLATHDKQPEYLIKLANENRGNLSLPEKLLWKRLKAPANREIPIRRQYPVLGRYIIDFFYEDLQLAIEVDGKSYHETRPEADSVRQEEIEAIGIAFLRLPASFVLRTPDEAAQLVLNVCRGEVKLEDLDAMFL